MVVVFLAGLFYPHIGGVEKHVLEISRLLTKKGCKVIILTERYNNNLKAFEELSGIDIYRINAGKDNFFKKFRVWFGLWKLRSLFKNADIIHAHDIFFWYLPFRFLYFNKPIFTTFHGYETKFPPSKKAIIIRKLSDRLSSGSICVGDYVKKWYGASSKYVTYGGVSIRNYHATVCGSYAKGIKILFIGRLEEDAGIRIYLRVMDVLKKKRVRFTFDACGDGPFRKEVERFGRVYGFVSDLASYIKSSDFVFASSYLSILEAMAAKKMVFSVYDNPLKEDYLKMSPFAQWIVIESSPEGLADKIIYFLKYQEKKKIITNSAYNWVKTQTWEKVVDKYLSLWK